jgi:F0F1-type ATP synthase membrane subunit b/b'
MAEAKRIGADGKEIVEDAKVGAEKIVGQARQKAEELKDRVVK